MAAINASQQLVDWGSPATQAALAEAQPEGSTLEAQMSLAQNLSVRDLKTALTQLGRHPCAPAQPAGHSCCSLVLSHRRMLYLVS